MEQFRDKIEAFSNYYEKHGFSPVASRVMIYLFLHADGEATFDELKDYFGVSKSAVSNALKLLSAMQIVSERTKSGERKRYFKASLEVIFSPASVVKSYSETRKILEDIRLLRNKKDAAAGELEDIIAFIKVLEVQYPEIYNRIQAQKKGKEV